MKSERGQALITLLFFMIIAGTITASAVAIVLTNSLSAGKLELSDNAYAIAETGIENGILRFLRDTSYQGETLQVDGGSASIQVASAGGNLYTITSEGKRNEFLRKIQVSLVYTNTMQITSWKEIY